MFIWVYLERGANRVFKNFDFFVLKIKNKIIFSDRFVVLMSKIIFLKKNYFNVFLSKKYFKSLPQYQTRN